MTNRSNEWQEIATIYGEAIERVRELHYSVNGGDCCNPDCTELHSNKFCFECTNDEYPCPTIKALDGGK